jgi:hypothetical protein
LLAIKSVDVEAVPATSGVRRTVRLAAALVVGQVLLVAVIGWVTFTYADKRPGGNTPAVERLAAPPAAIPPPAVPAPGDSATPAPPASTSTSGRTRTADPDLPVAPRSSSSPRPAAGPAAAGTSAPPGAPPVPPTVTAPVNGLTTPPLTLVPTADSPAVSTPTPTTSSRPPPIVAGQACTQMFALARAADGGMVRCLPARDHQLRWKIV